MPFITTQDEIRQLRSRYGDVWKSAILRISTVEVDSDTVVPNGEIVFSRESVEDRSELLYQEGPLSIHEIVVSEPFELLTSLIDGQIPLADGPIQTSTELRSHAGATTFSDSHDAKVREGRPLVEYNAVIDVVESDEALEEYSNIVEGLEERLRRSDEPYYDVGRAENYYFDYLFRTDRSHPAILVFANPDVSLSVNEDDTLELTIPEPLTEDVSLRVLPQRPYGENKGWAIHTSPQDFEPSDDDRVVFQTDLDLEDISKVYVILYVGDDDLRLLEHESYTGPAENDRFRILTEYDQANNLLNYIAGKEPDQFEKAVLNVLSTAGYIVQWFGDDDFVIPSWSDEVPGPQHQEVDLIAYSPDETEILFVECTNLGVSNKEQILDRSEAIASTIPEPFVTKDPGFLEIRRTQPVIATSLPSEKISDEVVSEFEEKGVKILDRERLLAIYSASQDQPGTVSIDTEFIEVK